MRGRVLCRLSMMMDKLKESVSFIYIYILIDFYKFRSIMLDKLKHLTYETAI